MKEILEKYCIFFTTDVYCINNMSFLHSNDIKSGELVHFFINGDEAYDVPFTDSTDLEKFILSLPKNKINEEVDLRKVIYDRISELSAYNITHKQCINDHMNTIQVLKDFKSKLDRGIEINIKDVTPYL